MIGRLELVDLRPTEEALAEELAAVERVLRSGVVLRGQEARTLEQTLEGVVGVGALAVGSGTDALSLALAAVGVGPGDEVVVPAMTAPATAAAVLALGAVPVPVDVRADVPLLDPGAVRRAATERTAAVVAVHLYGAVADLGELAEVAGHLGVPLVEDVAQALGATTAAGRPAGSVGRAAALSFYPTKHAGAAGDAGAVLSRDPAVLDRLRAWADGIAAGRADPSAALVRPSRIDEVQAALVDLRVRRLPAALAHRRALVDRYRSGLGAVLPPVAHGGGGAPHLLVVAVDDPGRLGRSLDRIGIGHGRHYPSTLGELPLLAGLAGLPDAPNARRWALGALLPLHERMGSDEVDRVVAAVLASLDDPGSGGSPSLR
ncbi:MAG: DegT/DnrJ/EryC1/StrS family aminotransferase [Acidimicrobiales bacterium]